MSPGAVRADGAEDWSHVRVDLGERGYDILIGQGLLAAAGRHVAPILRQPRLFVVTDQTVAALHLEPFARALDAAGVRHETLVLPSGEKSKSFAQLAELIDAMLAGHVERATTVAALGGGVVGDLAGFAASVALRGLDYVQVPTTLLAQVDSSVGGKTGINTAHGKNLVGSFHQPRLVLADTGVLDTLPRRELLAGYAEVVKYGLLGDAAFFAWLERQGAAVIAGDPAARRQAIMTCCRAKAAIVAADEREAGARALLNLGHTFAHALEAEARYEGALLHGEAVAAGMALAFELSAALGLCPAEDARRVRLHLSAIGLPDGLAALSSSFDADALIAHMAKDKKVRDGRLSFVLARRIGDAFLCADVGADSVRAVLRAAA